MLSVHKAPGLIPSDCLNLVRWRMAVISALMWSVQSCFLLHSKFEANLGYIRLGLNFPTPFGLRGHLKLGSRLLLKRKPPFL